MAGFRTGRPIRHETPYAAEDLRYAGAVSDSGTATWDFILKPLGLHRRALFAPRDTGALTELKLRAGLHFGHAEIFSGRRGFLHTRAPDLGGPIAGVAGWF